MNQTCKGYGFLTDRNVTPFDAQVLVKASSFSSKSSFCLHQEMFTRLLKCRQDSEVAVIPDL